MSALLKQVWKYVGFGIALTAAVTLAIMGMRQAWQSRLIDTNELTNVQTMPKEVRIEMSNWYVRLGYANTKWRYNKSAGMYLPKDSKVVYAATVDLGEDGGLLGKITWTSSHTYCTSPNTFDLFTASTKVGGTKVPSNIACWILTERVAKKAALDNTIVSSEDILMYLPGKKAEYFMTEADVKGGDVIGGVMLTKDGIIKRGPPSSYIGEDSIVEMSREAMKRMWNP
jgi:hypothetical protein